jgi:hypothetical protein
VTTNLSALGQIALPVSDADRNLLALMVEKR